MPKNKIETLAEGEAEKIARGFSRRLQEADPDDLEARKKIFDRFLAKPVARAARAKNPMKPYRFED